MLTLHIGIGKTATTTQQEVYFPGHPGIAYLGKAHCLEGRDRELHERVRGLLLQDGLSYDPAPGRELADRLVREAEGKGLAPLFSDENIIDSDRDKGLIIQRLKETFGPCRILLSIREQRGFLRALYGHDNNKLKGLPGPCNGRFISLEDWLEYHQRLLNRQRGWYWLGQYHRLARALAQAFGPENLHIMVFERFAADPRAFFADVCGFLGVEPDNGLADKTAATRLNPDTADRWLRKHLYMQDLKRRGSWLAGHPSLLRLAGSLYSNRHREPQSVNIAIPSEWDERLCDLFRESNRALAEEFNLPLAELGYAL